jgi:hypothetical protein
MSFSVGSMWLIERQGAPDQTIRVVESNPPNFSAEYVGIDNRSRFTGEVCTRQVAMLSLRQQHDELRYTAFHIGSRQGEQDEYVGAYGDVANGFSGRFRLILIPSGSS